ncbi:MAG TPA: PSD1 and planctomycete cytochrome C domain-containing protein [Chthoniobacter sp.]|nr:PSD1 and planctomycete cytochrome C domain-containing protein [Chthoniobacter sp.]
MKPPRHLQFYHLRLCHLRLCHLPFAIFALAITAPAILCAAETPADLLYVRRIAPLFAEKCLSCHGNDEQKIKGGLDMRSLASVLQGGDSGEPAFTPGKPEQSPLYLAATRQHESDWKPMPPKEADKLYAEQVGWIKDWIAGGAPWPDKVRVDAIAKANAAQWSAEDGLPVKTSGGLSAEWTNRKYKPEGLWAYQPVKKPATSQADSAAIDELIQAKLPADLPVAPAADRTTLLRRATFDLTGLPPTPEEIDAFLHDSRPDAEAFAKVVDRLLASRHYGERMAQHWLDVVRYADSSGFANDYVRGNSWRYRDYVVRAFNEDKPYDQFIREQIAGDEIDPQNPELLIATGFLRMGPWELTSMEVAKIARQRFLDDVTNSVGETFLAHSLQCARCHDHKFDPIPTRDYYGIQAVFGTTQLAERDAPFLPSENRNGFLERQYLESSRADHYATLTMLDEKSLKAADAWFAEKKIDPAQWQAALEQARQSPQLKRASLFGTTRDLLLKQDVPQDHFPPRMLGWTPEEIGMERVANKGLERLSWEMDRYKPFALAVYDGRTPQVKSVNHPVRMAADRLTEGELEEPTIHIGGDPFSPGPAVLPGVLSVLSDVQRTAIPSEIDGRRKAFADWVASERNPLTTRAIVNRIWLWHFGQGIAGNPNNFGSTGKKPTHPELLDWLAATFVEKGWSFKAMHRLIMNSEAYRRGTEHPNRKLLAEKDPNGTAYTVFQPRRLTAEELRDAMLAATGELNRTVGGIPNRPEMNLEAALQPRQVMGTFASAWTPNPLPKERNRRSLYSLKLRGLVDPAMEVFNAPAPDFSCERREASTVTPQVFSLFNSKTSYLRALALANRALRETQSDRAALERCFLLACGHRPEETEFTACLLHWRKCEAGSAPIAFVNPPLEVRRGAVEENTGERFAFTEKLPASVDFVPDLQPADVDAHTRALAEVCLVLFNSNDFAYVY